MRASRIAAIGIGRDDRERIQWPLEQTHENQTFWLQGCGGNSLDATLNQASASCLFV
jgi:hypothetical protein